MIAASEEFLKSVSPCISDEGVLERCHLRVAAMDAGSRLFIASPGHAMPEPSFQPAYWIEALVSDPYNSTWIRKAALRKIAEGMPFIGWSINADSRRIDGSAQPGEGEFIKYLGREDNAPVPLDVILLCDLCDERPATHKLHDETYMPCTEMVCEPCLEREWDRQQERLSEGAA